MSTLWFQPPPTYADPVLVDEKSGKAGFNPLWLSWFIELAQVLSTAGGGGGAVDHNLLVGLQGGAANQYYHLTAGEETDLTDGGDSALHYHSTDRARANATGTQLASTISDFTEASQDAIGGMVGVSLVYVDATPLLVRAALTGDVTSAQDSNALTIAANAVTNAKAAQMPTLTVKGNNTGGAADPLDLTVAQTQALLKAPVYLFAHYASVGNVGTGEDDLYSDTTAAGQLAANGDKIEVEYGGSFVSSGTATRQIKIYFGGTAIFATGALTLSLSSAWTIYASLIRVSGTVIRYMISMTTEGAALAAYTAVGELTGLTLSNTNVLKITGEAAGVGAATDDIVAKLGSVIYRPV